MIEPRRQDVRSKPLTFLRLCVSFKMTVGNTDYCRMVIGDHCDDPAVILSSSYDPS